MGSGRGQTRGLQSPRNRAATTLHTHPVEYSDGIIEWRVLGEPHGQLHREDGPAIESPDGTQEWWLCGKRHREDGPAVEGKNGFKAWFVHEKMHRQDGPAVEDDHGREEYWLDNQRMSK